jgi:hypothetical protein
VDDRTAVILSAVVRHWLDFGVISLLLGTNAVVGFWEEHQAGNAIAALKSQLAVNARVRRGGTWVSDGGNATLNAPNGLAFDNLGDLSAVSSASPSGIPIYGVSKSATAAPRFRTPFLVGATPTLNAPAGDVFGSAVQ